MIATGFQSPQGTTSNGPVENRTPVFSVQARSPTAERQAQTTTILLLI